MNVMIARVVGAVVAGFVVWIVSVLGLEVSEEQKLGMIEQLTQAVNIIGLVLWGLVYSVVHKITSKYTNPADTARNPQQASAVLHIPKK